MTQFAGNDLIFKVYDRNTGTPLKKGCSGVFLSYRIVEMVCAVPDEFFS